MDTNDHVDHQRWLIDNGFINDLHKDNLYMYGAIVHKHVEAVQVDIDVEKKLVSYDLYVDAKLLKRLDEYKELLKSSSIISLWRLKRLLKKEGSLDFHAILSKFVKDYLGPKWAVNMKIKNIKSYAEGFEQDATYDPGLNRPVNE